MNKVFNDIMIIGDNEEKKEQNIRTKSKVILFGLSLIDLNNRFVINIFQ
jgi:hypothetical protein